MIGIRLAYLLSRARRQGAAVVSGNPELQTHSLPSIRYPDPVAVAC